MDNDEVREDNLDQSEETENDVQESEDESTAEADKSSEEETGDESAESEDSNESDDEEKIDWKERALKAEKLIEKNNKEAKKAKEKPSESKQSGSDSNPDELSRVRLEARGILEKEDQDYVLKYAKAEDMNVVDALGEEVVKDKLAFLKKKRDQKAATSAPSGRTSAGGTNIDALVSQYKKNQTLPDDPELVRKIFKKLSQEEVWGAHEKEHKWLQLKIAVKSLR
jgi:hypothetical protein